MIDALAVTIARVGIRGLVALPLERALALGRFVGNVCYHALRLRRRVVLANLAHVLGDRTTEAERRQIAAESYRQFAMNVVEVARGLHAPEEVRGLVEIPQAERVRAMQKAGEPLILCIPHAGSFDRAGCGAAHLGVELHAMMTPVKSPRFNELLVASRERVGLHVLLKGEESFHEMFDLLDEGKTVVLLPDQNARRGVTVNFLGKPAVTFQGPAVLHLVTGAPLAVAIDRRRREDPRRHDAEVRFLPPYTTTGKRKEDIRAVTQQLCDVMGEMILEAPEQYLWLHRRWGKEVTRGEAAPA